MKTEKKPKTDETVLGEILVKISAITHEWWKKEQEAAKILDSVRRHGGEAARLDVKMSQLRECRREIEKAFNLPEEP